MAAMNKQQALAEQQRKRNNAAKQFEADGGKIRSTRNGEVYTDENGAMQPAGVIGGGNAINDYIDTILGASGVTNGQTQGDRSGSQGSGTGEGEGAGEEAGGDQADEKVVQESLNAGIPLELIAGGLLGAGAALIGRKLMAARGKKGGDPTSAAAGATGAASATDIVPSQTFGDGTINQDFIDATFDDVLGLPPPTKSLPPPNSDGTMPDAVMEQGAPAPTPVDDPNLYRTGDSPRTDVGQGYPEADPIADSIQQVEGGPSAKLADPMNENFAQQLAQMFAKQGNYNPPAISPSTKGVNMAIMARVRAILAGMRP